MFGTCFSSWWPILGEYELCGVAAWPWLMDRSSGKSAISLAKQRKLPQATGLYRTDGFGWRWWGYMRMMKNWFENWGSTQEISLLWFLWFMKCSWCRSSRFNLHEKHGRAMGEHGEGAARRSWKLHWSPGWSYPSKIHKLAPVTSTVFKVF